MSRLCGNCGLAGHNKRTCKAAPSAPPTAVEAPVAEPARSPGIDAETQEAIDWYLELRSPGILALLAAKRQRETNRKHEETAEDE